MIDLPRWVTGGSGPRAEVESQLEGVMGRSAVGSAAETAIEREVLW